MTITDKEKLEHARELIRQKKYTHARRILNNIDHPTAHKWLDKLDEIEIAALPDQPNIRNDYMPEERAAARMKSYSDKVVIVIVLYLFLFIPGLIANAIWHQEGKRMQKIAGKELPGVAILGLLRKGMFLIIAIPVVLLFIWSVSFALGNPF